MALVKVNINGIDIIENDNLTILQTVNRHNLDHIPTLCYEERLGYITSCFLCVVDVEGNSNLVPSCSTHIREGMVIKTKSKKAVEARKTCLELLFSDHYADCVSPCSRRCPAGIDIQGYLTLVKDGKYIEAIELIKEKNPLPIICGRVCVRDCEVGCRRSLLDEPVAIDFLKRYAAESQEGMLFTPKKKPDRNKSVVIVGAGPAGLSAAYYLAVEGYRVTILEAMPQGGGMLRYGIPSYRLPKDLLDMEIESIKKLGVEIRYDHKLGRDSNLEDLKEQYDAVLLTIGAWGAMGMRVENEEAEGVLSGLDILRQVTLGKLSDLKGRVLIIGGGNTAIDVSRTSVRLGADETVIVYRRTQGQMPAHREEIEAAQAEGVQFKFLTAPLKVVTDEEGKVTGLLCQKMKLGEPDKSGRPRPVPMEGSEYIEPCNYVVAAIGQYPDIKCLESGDKCSLPLNRWGNIDVDNETMETGIPGVFSTGDAATGASTAIEGIAGGRKAAYAIHAKLSGEKPPQLKKEFFTAKDLFRDISCEDFSCIEKTPRRKMPERNPKERIKDFDEVELGFSKEDILIEADRCFQCGCLEADDCMLRKYGEIYGVNPAVYQGDMNYSIPDKRHPYIIIDRNKCILCGRCIKTCGSILEGSALGFVKRGFETAIAPAVEKPLQETGCISCGNCIDTCPTGALSENMPLFARIGSKVKDSPAVCSFCSVGCKVNIRTFGRDMRIRSLKDPITGGGDYLCKKGRFGSRYLKDPERLLQPAQRRGNHLHHLEWKDALNKIAHKFSEIKADYGRNSTAVFVSPKLTNEEIYTANRFARTILETNCLGSFKDLFYGRSPREIDCILGKTASTANAEDIFKSDVIVLVNCDPSDTHPSFSWQIREAERQGKKLVIINSGRIGLTPHADLWLQPKRGTAGLLLTEIMKKIVENKLQNEQLIIENTDDYSMFKEFLQGFDSEEAYKSMGISKESILKGADLIAKDSPKVIIVYDFDNETDRSQGDLQAVANLLLLTGNLWKEGSGLLLLRSHCNSAGLYEMGAYPDFLPAGRDLKQPSHREFIESLWEKTLPPYEDWQEGRSLKDQPLWGKIKGALIIGEDPFENPDIVKLFQDMEMIVVVDLFNSNSASYADFILPASSHAESGGSFTSFDGRMQFFSRAFPPQWEMTNLQILCGLAEAMGETLNLDTFEKASEEIEKAVPLYSCFNKQSGSRITKNIMTKNTDDNSCENYSCKDDSSKEDSCEEDSRFIMKNNSCCMKNSESVSSGFNEKVSGKWGCFQPYETAAAPYNIDPYCYNVLESKFASLP